MKKQGTGIRDQGSEKLPGAPPFARRLREGWDGNSLPGVALILVAAAVATAPLVWNGFSCGHDFDFHLVSWMDALNAWRHGVFYPQWTESANYGAGEPRFVFYPPLTWMLGAALGALFGWQAAPVVLTFVLLATTGLAVRALAKQFLPDGAGTLAGCVAIFSGYALYCVYERAAYGELAGGCTIPLVLLFAMKNSRLPEQTGQAKSTAFYSLLPIPYSLSFAIAASWLANAPVGVMVCYLLAAFSLILAVTHRSWQPILRATIGTLLGVGLAAFYLVPAAVEQKWSDIREAIDDPGLQIENSFLFARHASPLLRDHDIELHKTSIVAAVMLALAVAAILLCWLRCRMPGGRKLWLPLALIPLAILFLQFPISLPVWNLLPKLRFLQFPWRWLVVLEAPLGIFVAAAIWPRTRWPRFAAAAVFTAAFAYLAFFAGTRFHQQCDDEDAIAPMTAAYDAYTGFVGTDEYAPIGADDSLVASNLPAACLVSDPATELGQGDPDDPPPEWSADQHTCDAAYSFAAQDLAHRRIEATAPHAGWLILRLRQYPAWTIRVNGAGIDNFRFREDGLYAIPVAAGRFTLTADWTTTPDVALGRALSLAALLVAAILLFLDRRRTT